MIALDRHTRIYAYTQPADMRKGFDGLSGLVRRELGADPTDGSLFLFINRRRDRMKILHFDGGGFWLYYRLLEEGTFETLTTQDDSSTLRMDATELSMLLEGVTLQNTKRRRKRRNSRSR